jgi:hypothetical protein
MGPWSHSLQCPVNFGRSPARFHARACVSAYRELLINSLITALVWGNAGIAQLVEQLICNQQVVGSNPSAGSNST